MHFQSVVVSHCTYADESISTQHGHRITLRRAMRWDLARHESEAVKKITRTLEDRVPRPSEALGRSTNENRV